MTRLTELLEAATPEKWELCDKGDYADFDGNSRVIIGDNRRLAVVQVSDDETNANAELIVHLVNRAREIERVIEAAKEFHEGRTRLPWDCLELVGLANKLSAALAELERHDNG